MQDWPDVDAVAREAGLPGTPAGPVLTALQSALAAAVEHIEAYCGTPATLTVPAPEGLKIAAVQIAAQIYKHRQRPGPQRPGVGETTVSVGFLVPRQAASLMAPFLTPVVG